MKLMIKLTMMVLFLGLCVAAAPVSTASSGSCSTESIPTVESESITTRTNCAPVEIGEEKIAGQFEDGTLLYVTLVECESSDPEARGEETR